MWLLMVSGKDGFVPEPREAAGRPCSCMAGEPQKDPPDYVIQPDMLCLQTFLSPPPP